MQQNELAPCSGMRFVYLRHIFNGSKRRQEHWRAVCLLVLSWHCAFMSLCLTLYPSVVLLRDCAACKCARVVARVLQRHAVMSFWHMLKLLPRWGCKTTQDCKTVTSAMFWKCLVMWLTYCSRLLGRLSIFLRWLLWTSQRCYRLPLHAACISVSACTLWMCLMVLPWKSPICYLSSQPHIWSVWSVRFQNFGPSETASTA